MTAPCRSLLMIAAACLSGSVAVAGFDPGDSVAVTLSSGELLKGRVVSDPSDGLVIDNLLLGDHFAFLQHQQFDHRQFPNR